MLSVSRSYIQTSSLAYCKMLTYTKPWAIANPDRVQSLLQASIDCPICLQAFGPDLKRLSPLEGEFRTTCCHACCESCLAQLLEQPIAQWKCPVCRADISQWLVDEFGYIPPDCVDFNEIRAFVRQVLAALGPQATPSLRETGDRILRHL